jgi:uncharacterized protein YkwD
VTESNIYLAKLEQPNYLYFQGNARKGSGPTRLFKTKKFLIIVIATLILTTLATMLTIFIFDYKYSPIANAANFDIESGNSSQSDDVYFLQSVNNLRLQNNLAPLKSDKRLIVSAKQKTDDMIANKYWAHYSPTSGPSFSDFIWNLSPDAKRVGENLARCYDDRKSAFDALVKSPTHYAIMVGDFTNFGVFQELEPVSGCNYVTMHFSLYN